MERPKKSLFVVGFNKVSNLLHYFIGLMLMAVCGILIYRTMLDLGGMVVDEDLLEASGRVLDNILFVIMVLEIAHTVIISYKEHVIRPEPFLVVGLIASVRRILILTISTVELHMDEKMFRIAMIETGMLAGVILVLVVSIILLRKFSKDAVVPKD